MVAEVTGAAGVDVDGAAAAAICAWGAKAIRESKESVWSAVGANDEVAPPCASAV
jgi:hypothetical protein